MRRLLLLCLFFPLLSSCHFLRINQTLKKSADCKSDYQPPACLSLPAQATEEFDIFLIIGQSNTCGGTGIDPILDAPHPRILQLGRHNGMNLKVIPAIEPLEHHHRIPNAIGFALPFAKEYVCNLLEENRTVLLIPSGMGGTGFKDKRWGVNNDLYADALERVNFVLKNYPSAKVKAILWHQGEKDVNNKQYIQQLDTMINTLRQSIQHDNSAAIPFILGGMVPTWVDRQRSRKRHEYRICTTPLRIPHTAFANPRQPCVIRKENNDVDRVHYDAAGQRLLGKRYFSAYVSLH